MSEAELLKFTLAYLKQFDVCHWRMPLGAVMRTIGKRIIHCPSPIKGMPDICGITDRGVFFGLELKSKKGRLSPEQVEWQAKIKASNGIALVIRNTTEVISFVYAMKNNMVSSQNETTTSL